MITIVKRFVTDIDEQLITVLSGNKNKLYPFIARIGIYKRVRQQSRSKRLKGNLVDNTQIPSYYNVSY